MARESGLAVTGDELHQRFGVAAATFPEAASPQQRGTGQLNAW
ncbi:hypothetical protein L083_1715 [Actinoplanes sp. N902-109]|nr:hypothetical protein L083_1715 [Actinoplanes sp. N902-109]